MMAFISSVCLRVSPYTIEYEPQELLPTMPPIMALLAVEVFGPKYNPYGFKKIFNSSRTTPGCNLTHPSSLFTSSIFVKYLDTSTTMPAPTHCPASEVPAVRGINESLFCVANSMSFFISSSTFG